MPKEIDIDNELEKEHEKLQEQNLEGDVLWLNYKGHEIRIEKSKLHNNNNLVITVHPDSESDYTHRLEVNN
mgnify:CR=1 FL=1